MNWSKRALILLALLFFGLAVSTVLALVLLSRQILTSQPATAVSQVTPLSGAISLSLIATIQPIQVQPPSQAHRH